MAKEMKYNQRGIDLRTGERRPEPEWMPVVTIREYSEHPAEEGTDTSMSFTAKELDNLCRWWGLIKNEE